MRASPKHYSALGQPHEASVEACAKAFERLATKYDPRHRPATEQAVWIAYQDAIDEAMAVIHDAATDWGRAA